MTRPKRGLRQVALLSMTVAAFAVAPASAGAAETRAAANCRIQTGPTITITSVRNMSCRSAAREIRRYRGPVYRRFRTPGGFTCSRVSGGRLGGTWRCARGARAFRFSFGD